MRGRFCGAALAAIVFGMLVAAPAFAAAPANDKQEKAIGLAPAASGSLPQSTVGATREPDESDHAGDRGGASVWFTWMPNVSGPVAIDTNGSDFDTLLEVRGMGGALVASNDDAAQAASSSMVCFNATNGSSVSIAVDGYAGASGSLHLNWTSSPDLTVSCPTLPPTLSGNVAAPKVGDLLTGTVGTWTPQAGVVSMQWERCIELRCQRITGATGSSYSVQLRDIGWALRFDVQMVRGGQTFTNISDPSGVAGQVPVTRPNGRVFWTSRRTGDWELFSQLANGSGLLQVTNHLGVDTEAATTVDGSGLAWREELAIMVGNPDGSGAFQVAPDGTTPVWSPDEGTRIAYIDPSSSSGGIRVTDGVSDVYVLRLGAGQAADLAWSPDGTKLAFSYWRGGSNWSIAVVRADGRGDVTFLTDGTTRDRMPVWSPDGTRIAFVHGVSSAIGPVQGDLYVMAANGSGQALYVNGSSLPVYSASWSPDGTKLVYSQDVVAESDDLFTIPAGAPGGTPTLFASSPTRDMSPHWAAATSFPLSVDPIGTGNYTVTLSPSVPCANGCDAVYPDGTTVTVTANPASDTVFSGWGGSCISATGATCTLTMNGPRDVAMFFALKPPFTPPPPGGGGGGGGGGGSGGPHLTLALSAKTTSLAPNETDDIVAVVSNDGLAGALGTHLKFDLPATMTLLGPPSFQSGSGCTGTQSIDCNLDYVPNGGTTRVAFSVRVSGSGPQTLTARVDYNNPATTTASLTVQVSTPTTTLPPPPVRSTTSTRGVTRNGTAKANTLTGTARNDTLRGLGGNDLLRGLGGADTLVGGPGNDRLLGGDGVDRLVGGSGHDRFAGGAGNDRIEARDGERDTVDCGAGRDTVIADKLDVVGKNCEQATRK